MRATVLTIVIVTYRSADTVAACLRSLGAALGTVRAEVVVVDNGSDDGTVDAVRDLIAELSIPIALIERADNAGFAAGCNAGLEKASGDWVLFLNPDTVCPSGSLEALVDASRALPSAGLVAPALVAPDGNLQPTVERDYRLGRYLLGLVRIGGANRARPPPAAGPPVEVAWVHAAAALLPLGLARSLGGFDERFFLYMEDMDLCTRVRATGRAVVVVPEVRIHHVGGASGEVSGGAPVIAGRRVAGLATYLAVHQGRWAAAVFGVATAASATLVAATQALLRRPAAEHWAMARAGARVALTRALSARRS